MQLRFGKSARCRRARPTVVVWLPAGAFVVTANVFVMRRQKMHGGEFGNGTEGIDGMRGAVRYNAAIEAQIVAAFGNLPAHARIIDIGAGYGEYAERMRVRGFDVTCVEPHDERRAELSTSGFAVVAAVAELQGVYDGAYMINVLEHVQDDVGLLGELAECLLRGAPLFVWVPALEVLYSDFDFAVGHYRRYSRRRLARVLEVGGFDVQDTRYRDVLGSCAAAVWKVLPRREQSVASSAMIEAYDRYVFPVSDKLDRVTGHVLGKNCAAVARRL